MSGANLLKTVAMALFFIMLSGCHNLPHVVVPTEIFLTEEARMKTQVVVQMTEIAVKTVTAEETFLDEQASDAMAELTPIIEKDDINGFYRKLLEYPDAVRTRLKSFVLENLYNNMNKHKVNPPRVDLSDSANHKNNFYPDINDELFRRYEIYQSILEFFHFDLSDGGNELLTYTRDVLALKKYKDYIPAFRFFYCGYWDAFFNAQEFDPDKLSTASAAYDRVNRLDFENMLAECKFTANSYGWRKITSGFESIRVGLKATSESYASSYVSGMISGLEKCMDGLSDFESLLSDDFYIVSAAFENDVPAFPNLDMK